MSSIAPEFETRPTCEGCTWHDTMPESWYAVSLVGHYCFRESGAPTLRGVACDDDYPLGCCHRYDKKERGL